MTGDDVDEAASTGAERFIPFQKSDLISMCAGELPDGERESFLRLTRMVESLVHHEFRQRIEALKNAYHPFARDTDTRLVAELTKDERLAAQRRVERALGELARTADFVEIDHAELRRSLDHHALLKVRLAVDEDALDTLLLFRRGQSQGSQRVPILWGLGRRTVHFTNYARVLLYARFKDREEITSNERLLYEPGSMMVKMFRNVPRDDVEMIIPTVKVEMRPIDKVMFGVPAAISGIIVLITKLVAKFGILVLLASSWLGLRHTRVAIDRAGLVSIAAGVLAIGGYLWRQFSTFRNRKMLFLKKLSENLYFRNLDNDAGVFHHLLDAAEEAEVKQAVLAYHFLRNAERGLTPDELSRAIEDRFAQRMETTVDIEIEGGLRRLQRFELVGSDELGRLLPVDLAEARERLDRRWDRIFREPAAEPYEPAEQYEPTAELMVAAGTQPIAAATQSETAVQPNAATQPVPSSR